MPKKNTSLERQNVKNLSDEELDSVAGGTNSIAQLVEEVIANKQALPDAKAGDTDFATGVLNFNKANILSQAGTSMLAQTNQQARTILKLLG